MGTKLFRQIRLKVWDKDLWGRKNQRRVRVSSVCNKDACPQPHQVTQSLRWLFLKRSSILSFLLTTQARQTVVVEEDRVKTCLFVAVKGVNYSWGMAKYMASVRLAGHGPLSYGAAFVQHVWWLKRPIQERQTLPQPAGVTCVRCCWSVCVCLTWLVCCRLLSACKTFCSFFL